MHTTRSLSLVGELKLRKQYPTNCQLLLKGAIDFGWAVFFAHHHKIIKWWAKKRLCPPYIDFS